VFSDRHFFFLSTEPLNRPEDQQTAAERINQFRKSW